MIRDMRAGQCAYGKLQCESTRGIQRLQFILLEYRFFMDSEEGSALPLRLPWIFSPLSLLTHIIKSHALVLLRLSCYFVTLQTKIVGLFAIQEHHESLYVASLGVAREYRRLGIGTRILAHIEATARHAGKRWLEVDVLRKNASARRLYTNYGFTFVGSQKNRFTIRGAKPL